MQNAIVRVPVARGDGGRQADQRPGGVHARRRVHPRPVGRARLLGRGRLLRARPRRRGRHGTSSSPSGSSTARRRSTSGTWTPAASAPRTGRREYTLARTKEIYETYYDVKYPGHERQAGRPLRDLARLRAACASSARSSARSPAGSARTGSSRTRPRGRVASAARLGREALVARDRRRAPRLPGGGGAVRRVVLREDRRDAAPAPPRSSRVSAPTGSRARSARVTYTQMLNARGGIECDFTVTRLADDRFRIVTGTAFGQHDLAWIRQHAPRGRLRARRGRDVGQYACFGLWGPDEPRDLLQPLTTTTSRTRRSRT